MIRLYKGDIIVNNNNFRWTVEMNISPMSNLWELWELYSDIFRIEDE